MTKWSPVLQILFVFFFSFFSSVVVADVASLQKEIDEIDNSISVRKAQLAGKNASLQVELDALEKEQKNNEKRLERHDRKISRAQERFDFVDGNINELDKWYKSLGAIDQGLNSATYETKKNALSVDKNTSKTELNELQAEKRKMEADSASNNDNISKLKTKLSSSTKTINSDKQIQALLKKKQAKVGELEALKKSSKPAFSGKTYHAYVYVISGNKTGEVEKALKLKKWVESYQAKYVESNWNDFTAKNSPTSGSILNFLNQMDQELNLIPEDSKVILIGYGLGGGAAVLAATEVAKKKNRDIDFLVTIDPMGPGDSRLTAVYRTDAVCQSKISMDQYLNCLKHGKKRVITKNVKSFYNRWQRESGIPVDAKDRVKVGNQDHALATGKFLIESSSTESNQQRIYYNDKDAHQLLLNDAAEELPKILVEYLR